MLKEILAAEMAERAIKQNAAATIAAQHSALVQQLHDAIAPDREAISNLRMKAGRHAGDIVFFDGLRVFLGVRGELRLVAVMATNTAAAHFQLKHAPVRGGSPDFEPVIYPATTPVAVMVEAFLRALVKYAA